MDIQSSVNFSTPNTSPPASDITARLPSAGPSAINCLPDELLHTIFLEVIGDANPMISVAPPKAARESPLLCLSQVCASWRSVAAHDTGLWTEYTIDVSPTTSAGQAQLLLSLLRRCISNSGNRSLSINFTDHCNKAGHVLAQLLASYSHRIADLTFNLNEAGARELVLGSEIRFNRLRDLVIRVQPPRDPEQWMGLSDAPIMDLCALAPALTRLTIAYEEWHPIHAPGAILFDLGLSFASLSVLHLTSQWLHFAECIFIFRECLQLAECHVCCDEALGGWPQVDLSTLEGRWPQVDLSSGPTILPRLNSLHITFRAMNSHLWDVFDAPNLADLRITTLCDDDSDAWNHAKFMDFQERSDFTLTTLALRFDFSDMVNDIIDLLQKSPALETLELRWTTIHQEPSDDIEQLLEALTFDGSKTTLPNLTRFRIDGTEDSVRMLQSRCPPQSMLTSITLYVQEPFTPSDSFSTAVGTLQSTGVTVEQETMDFYGSEFVRPLWMNVVAEIQDASLEDGWDSEPTTSSEDLDETDGEDEVQEDAL
ncbi:hypothetical protein C8R45DRAFT_973760 [Mycena sanguinolenta]|nr:hypothetical protein C8R45DRAFT_973760 [Mycena sanguinolenta]